jgi:hypothetical protein
MRTHPAQSFRACLLAGAMFLAMGASTPAFAQETLRRFAVIAGNDEGGNDTRRLFYAREDARKIHDILLRVGGVRPDDASLVLNGSSDAFLKALAAMERRVEDARKKGQRTALLVYYSGHAKDGSLRLGSTQVPMDALKARLSQSPADIRLAVFDACRSGLLTRTKGARLAPTFDVQTDAARDARGMVILTSSASDEDSQESDTLRGSYFSHHLASALLGDADRSGDGRITLSEAYAYAYQRTVADTSESAAGAQHPTFSYDLAGNGDLVLTDVGSRAEGILFASALPAANYYVVDRRGFIAAEVLTDGLQERRIALAPGKYRVKRRLIDGLQIGEVQVVAGNTARVDGSLLRPAPFTDDPVKGGYRRMTDDRVALGVTAGYQAFFDSATRQGLFPPLPLFGLELELREFLRPGWLWSFDAMYGTRRTPFVISQEMFNARFSQLNAGTTIGVDWPFGDFHAFLGARATALWMTRSFEDVDVPSQSFLTFSPGIVLGARYNFGSLSLQLRGRVHYMLYNLDVNQPRSLGFWDLGGVVAYEL